MLSHAQPIANPKLLGLANRYPGVWCPSKPSLTEAVRFGMVWVIWYRDKGIGDTVVRDRAGQGLSIFRV